MTQLVSGARRSEILQYTAEKWGLSARQTDDYIAAASELVKQEAARAREENFTEQAALRRLIRKQAMGAGDLRLALDVAKDEAKLHDLYPSEKHDITATITQKGYGVISPDDWDKYDNGGTPGNPTT